MMRFKYKPVEINLVSPWELPYGKEVRIEPIQVNPQLLETVWTITHMILTHERGNLGLKCQLAGETIPYRILVTKSEFGGSYIRPQLPEKVRILSC